LPQNASEKQEKDRKQKAVLTNGASNDKIQIVYAGVLEWQTSRS
jgi:hypothetical protein